LNYQSIGSGGGIKQIKAKTVTFGASDKPLDPSDLEASGLVQFPMIMGGTVLVVNLPGIKPGELTLDGPTLAKIFLGTITSWDDPAIKALNPSVSLPSKAVAVVHRSDGSGTTFLFTNYLSQVSTDWQSQVGANTAVQWPVGIGAKGNEGVANMAKQTDGSIGYVEYAYAKQNNLTYTKLVNKDGKTLEPGLKAFQAAAANANWAGAKDYYLILTNQPGAESWPITGASFIIVYKRPVDPQATLTALKFFDWAYKNGGDAAEQLDYVPIPAPVVTLIEKTWADSIKDSIGKSLWQ
jgi:phosphate transport system substrate-binding protein